MEVTKADNPGRWKPERAENLNGQTTAHKAGASKTMTIAEREAVFL